MRRTLITAAAVLSLAAAPPPTDVKPVRDVFHGTEVVDPYRWLEGSAAPEMAKPDPGLDAKVGAWTDAQNAYARAILDNLPGRKELEARVKAVTGRSGFRTAPVVRGGQLFFLAGSPEQSQPVLMTAEGEGPARTLVDPSLRDPSGLTTIGWFAPSHDGRLVAVGLFRSGDENATLHLVETGTGRWLPDEIRNKVREVDWLPDGSGFVYNNLEDLTDPFSRRIRFHKVGTDAGQDRVLLEQPKEGPAASTWGPFGRLSRDGRWLVLGQWTGSNSNDLWVMDFRQWLETGKAEHRPIVVGQKAQSGLPDVYRYADPIVGDTFYMSTTLKALNRRVVAVDLKDPSPEGWRELIPERKDALVYIWQVGDLLAGIYLQNATTRIELFELDGTPRGRWRCPASARRTSPAAPRARWATSSTPASTSRRASTA